MYSLGKILEVDTTFNRAPENFQQKVNLVIKNLRRPTNACPSQSIESQLLKCDQTAFVDFEHNLEQYLTEEEGKRKRFTKSTESLYTPVHNSSEQIQRRKTRTLLPVFLQKMFNLVSFVF